MTETTLLVIIGFVLTIAIQRFVKYWTVVHKLSSRAEAIIRMTLMCLAALLVHLVYASSSQRAVWWWSGVVANAFVLYGALHFFDRMIFKKGRERPEQER